MSFAQKDSFILTKEELTESLKESLLKLSQDSALRGGTPASRQFGS